MLFGAKGYEINSPTSRLCSIFFPRWFQLGVSRKMPQRCRIEVERSLIGATIDQVSTVSLQPTSRQRPTAGSAPIDWDKHCHCFSPFPGMNQNIELSTHYSTLPRRLGHPTTSLSHWSGPQSKISIRSLPERAKISNRRHVPALAQR